MASAGDRAQAIAESLALLDALGGGSGPTSWIARIETGVHGLRASDVRSSVARDGIDRESLEAALEIKRLAGQINVLVHAVGILNALPYVLDPDEIVVGLSLGAGNTGRKHDLETDRRIAEFKFIDWRGGPESIRQNGVFADLFNLAESTVSKRRVLYLTGTKHALRFLGNRRALSSVMSRNGHLDSRFQDIYGDRFERVNEYYAHVKDRVEIVELIGLVPGLTEIS